jgi:iron complex transport system substrate-binding protein
VSLSPTHTETLFALDLGHLVVAVDSASDYPSAALDVRQTNLIAESASLDELLSYEPDVVLVGEDFTGIVGRLSAAGVASWSGPPATSLDDVYRQIEELGDVVGFRDRADELVGRMRADLEALVSSLPAGDQLSYFFEVDPSYVTASPGTYLDSLFGTLGLTSIAPSSEDAFVQLSADTIISANPDVIILADANCCGVGIDQVAARPGWSSVSALANGAVVTIDDAVASRWGPRTIELLESVAGAVVAAS